MHTGRWGRMANTYTARPSLRHTNTGADHTI